MNQQKRNIALLISLGVLSLVSLLLLVAGNNSTTPIDPTLFKLTDPLNVNHVVIQKPNDLIDLHFANGWKVSDSLDADRNLVDVLFATVDQAIPKRLIASRIEDSVRQSLRYKGVKASFYSNESLQKQFIVWGDAKSGITYFSEPDYSNIYVVVIPGYRVQVSGIFEQSSKTWRDKRIFNFRWRNFKDLLANFPRDPKQDFKIALNGKYFSIVDEVKVDTTLLNDYLDAVSFITADDFYNQGESVKIDSLIKTTPIMSIMVRDVADNSIRLNLYEIGEGQRNAIAKWNSDYVWFDRRNILPIYKKKKDFVK